VRVNGVTVGAIVACNALGDVLDPSTGRILAGSRQDDGSLLDTQQALLRGQAPKRLIPGGNTTIGVIATDALLTKAQAARLATVGHDGFARTIQPAHTMLDGDTLFALATGRSGQSLDMMTLAALAAEVVARAIVNAVSAATAMHVEPLHLPAARDLA
jgi:L-aminopeptidase/D-esterase-like protein